MTQNNVQVQNQSWDKLQLLREQLKTYFKQREDLVDGTLTALLAGVHLLVIGPPGTAKSLLATVLCALIPGARYFYFFLNKFTTWTQLACGQTIVCERDSDQGKSISFRNVEGQLLMAHIVFLDEIFKANPATLNSLLSYLNERTYTINAGEVGRAPVMTVFAASNELPGKEDSQLLPFSDRFLLRYEVQYISNSQEGDTDFVDMLADTHALPDAAIDFPELTYFQAEVSKVYVTRRILTFVSAIRAALSLDHQIQPSDRRYRESVKVLKAYAFLNGHAEVQLEDLAVLEHVLWTGAGRAERDAVRKVIHSITREKSLLEAAAQFDEAERLYSQAAAAIRHGAVAVPFDEDQRREVDAMLAAALGAEQRLAAISESLAGVCAAAAPNVQLTVRTFVNQVNVYRKHLVSLRRVENPFLLLPASGDGHQAQGKGIWAQA